MHPKSLLQAAAVLCLSAAALAQTATYKVAALPSSGIPLVVTSSPYTAQEWTTVTFAHPDGTTSTMLHRADLARNIAGSTRRDLRTLASNSAAAQPTGSLSVDIHDAANYLAIHLIPAANTATVHELRKTQRPYTLPVSTPVGAAVSAPSQDLGSRTIAGLTATGSRRNLVFQAGIKDPSQDVTQTIDTWVSPDLKIVLRTETHDSLGNSTVTELTQLVQGEPDPSLFTVPQNYAVTTVPLQVPAHK